MKPQSGLEMGTAFDLTARAKLRITGADRFRYLNGQISNDLGKASETAAIHACVLTAKGKINADVFLTADGESVLIDCESDMRAPLAARFERYIIADDVQIEDMTEELSLFHIIGAAPGNVIPGARSRESNRFGCEGVDLWLERDQHESALQVLATMLSLPSEEAAETFRIERGVPKWGYELTDEIIPTEANLESSAIDYAKGCYIGQEVISRIKMSGQTNKRLCGLVAVSNCRIAAGMHLLTAAPEGRDVGWVTSAARSERLGKEIALGFVKRGFWAPGSRLDARAPEIALGAPTIPLEIVELPFLAR